jgi:hypothetical protein
LIDTLEPIQRGLQRVASRRQIQKAEHSIAGGRSGNSLVVFQISQRNGSAAEPQSRGITQDSLERRGLCGRLAREALILGKRGCEDGDRAQPRKLR